MPTPVDNLMVFAITTFVAVFLFAVIPGFVVVIAGFLVGVVVSIPILAVALLTRLVSADPPTGETE